MAHAAEFLDHGNDLNVMVRSPSGDTDIIIFICLRLTATQR